MDKKVKRVSFVKDMKKKIEDMKNGTNDYSLYLVKDLQHGFNPELYKKGDKINRWITLYYMKKDYPPNWIKIKDGGVYTFDSEPFIFQKNLQKILNIMNEEKEIVGLVVKKTKKNGNVTYIVKLWTIDSKKDTKIMNKIKSLNICLRDELYFDLFFPEPIKNDKTLSMIKLRNKIIYFIRYDIFIGRYLAHKGWWELNLYKDFKKYYREGSNILDIGAFIGTHVLLLSEIINKNGQIYAFDPLYTDIIKKNVKANHLEKKVNIYEVCVGGENKEVEIDEIQRDQVANYANASLVKNVNYAEQIKKKKVKMITIDSLQIKNISIIKIDVEGFELEVMKGAIKTIQQERPVIFIEIWNKEKEKFISNPIYKKIIELGYRLHFINGINHADYVLLPNSI
jgi:FkbM family methyltransferase